MSQAVSYYDMFDKDKQTEVVRGLSRLHLTVAAAESCTGGLIAARLTDVPGASAVFHCGVVSYSNEIKASVLGVNPETLRDFSAVSAETAAEMAARATPGGIDGSGALESPLIPNPCCSQTECERGRLGLVVVGYLALLWVVSLAHRVMSVSPTTSAFYLFLFKSSSMKKRRVHR